MIIKYYVYGQGWIELRDFFDPSQKFGLVGLVTQPSIFELGSGWVVNFFKKNFINPQFIIIQIKSSIKYIKSSQTNTNQFIIIHK